jgi:hypothetical protein
MTPRSFESICDVIMSSTLIYPTGGEYREALYNTKLCFNDIALIGGAVAVDQLGMPRPISGAFASVFTIEGVDGRRWAVKCFTRYVDQQEIRYRRISETLRNIRDPWRVEFEYLPNGVLALGKWFPLLKMEWVDGTGLMSFIENNLWDSVKLSELAVKFARLIQDLSVLGIAHGDLQHGNLLVTSTGELKLIDYDGMFVPSLARLGACEKGHINYQSPNRTMNNWGPNLDNFSAWIIYVSLVALTFDPTLWTVLHDQGDEALIFNHSDFGDPHQSRALTALRRSSMHELRNLGNVLTTLWASDLSAIPALDPVALAAPSKQSSIQTAMLSTPGTGGSASARRPMPDWIAQVQQSSQAKTSGSQTGLSWVTSHLSPLPPIAFQPRRALIRFLLAFTLTVTVVAGVSAHIGILPEILSLGLSCAIVFLFVITTLVFYRNTSERRARKEKLVDFRGAKAEASQAAQDVSQLERTRNDIDRREQKAVEGIARESNKAKTSEKKELDSVDRRLATQIRDLEKRKQSLQKREDAELGQALRILQQQYVSSRLSAASIISARIPGIGDAVARSLASHGINSAADFSGLQHRTGPRGGQQIYIVLRNGFAVHPSGVGEKKARDLDNWRRNVEGAVRASQPASLPLTHSQAIRSKYAQERQALADQEKIVRAQATADRRQVQQKWAPVHVANSAKITPTHQVFAQERAQIDVRLTAARKKASSDKWLQESADRELAAYRDVSYRRYLLGVFRG